MIHDNRADAIAATLADEVARMRTGERLPGVRELSKRFQASAATVSDALARLAAHGLVRTEPGRGTFASSPKRTSEPDYSWQSQTLGPARVDADRASRLGSYGSGEHLPLSWGYLSGDILPQEDLQRITSRAAKNPRSWSMTAPAGSPELRRVIAAEYRADPADVLVVSGGQQGLVFAMRTLAEPGATVITESPSYPGAILAAQSAGLSIASVPADADGIIVERLAGELERTKARIIYLQPSFANPTGAVLSPSRRAAVIELAAAHGAFIIEDDWARHLAFAQQPPPPLFGDDPHGHVVTVTTFSKPASPGLRLGAIIARGPAGERLRASRTADDLCVSPLTQEIGVALLTSQAWPRHLGRLRTALTERRNALLASLETSLPEATVATRPTGGLHLWAKLPSGTNTSQLTDAAYRAGLLVGDGRHFFVNEPPAPFIRLSFGAATPAQIAEGVRELGAALRDLTSAE